MSEKRELYLCAMQPPLIEVRSDLGSPEKVPWVPWDAKFVAKFLQKGFRIKVCDSQFLGHQTHLNFQGTSFSPKPSTGEVDGWA